MQCYDGVLTSISLRFPITAATRRGGVQLRGRRGAAAGDAGQVGHRLRLLRGVAVVLGVGLGVLGVVVLGVVLGVHVE
jgi:hypothetical protein